MPFIPATIGAALLAYVVYLISGVGIAVIAFFGIMLIVWSIYWMLLQVKGSMVTIHGIETNQHYELKRVVYDIQNTLRK